MKDIHLICVIRGQSGKSKNTVLYLAGAVAADNSRLSVPSVVPRLPNNAL